MYRDFVEHDSAYELLANAYLARATKPPAMKALTDYSNAGGRSPETLIEAREAAEGGRQAGGCDQDARAAGLYLSHGGRAAPKAWGPVYRSELSGRRDSGIYAP